MTPITPWDSLDRCVMALFLQFGDGLDHFLKRMDDIVHVRSRSRWTDDEGPEGRLGTEVLGHGTEPLGIRHGPLIEMAGEGAALFTVGHALLKERAMVD